MNGNNRKVNHTEVRSSVHDQVGIDDSPVFVREHGSRSDGVISAHKCELPASQFSKNAILLCPNNARYPVLPLRVRLNGQSRFRLDVDVLR